MGFHLPISRGHTRSLLGGALLLGLLLIGIFATNLARANDNPAQFEPQAIDVCYNSNNGSMRTLGAQPISCRNNEIQLTLASFADLVSLKALLESEVLRLEDKFDEKLANLRADLEGEVERLDTRIDDEEAARGAANDYLQEQIDGLTNGLTFALTATESDTCDLDEVAQKLCEFQKRATQAELRHESKLQEHDHFKNEVIKKAYEVEDDEDLRRELEEQRMLKLAFRDVLGDDSGPDFQEKVKEKLEKISRHEEKQQAYDQVQEAIKEAMKKDGETEDLDVEEAANRLKQEFEKQRALKEALKRGIDNDPENPVTDEDFDERLKEKLEKISRHEEKQQAYDQVQEAIKEAMKKDGETGEIDAEEAASRLKQEFEKQRKLKEALKRGIDNDPENPVTDEDFDTRLEEKLKKVSVIESENDGFRQFKLAVMSAIGVDLDEHSSLGERITALTAILQQLVTVLDDTDEDL